MSIIKVDYGNVSGGGFGSLTFDSVFHSPSFYGSSNPYSVTIPQDADLFCWITRSAAGNKYIRFAKGEMIEDYDEAPTTYPVTITYTGGTLTVVQSQASSTTVNWVKYTE